MMYVWDSEGVCTCYRVSDNRLTKEGMSRTNIRLLTVALAHIEKFEASRLAYSSLSYDI
jgi:hypothetical protein